MTILTFSHSFSGKKYPGLQAKLYDECTALSKKFQLTIITEEGSSSSQKNPILIKIPKIPIPIIETLYRILFFSILTIKNRNNYDLVYIRYLSVHFLISGIIAKLFLKKKLVLQLSGPRINAKGYRGKFFRPYLRKALDIADIVCSNSEFVLSSIEKYLGSINRQKVRLFNEGINTNHFKPSEISSKNNVLLTVSRISSVKAIENMIECLPYVKKEIPDILLRIVGSVDDKTYYRKLKLLISELKCERHVDFVGPISNEKVPEYYNSSKIFLLTSKSEGSSISTLEAMACGKPVIVTSVGGLKSLIKDGYDGYFVNHNEPQILAEKITSLLMNESLYIEIGKNARKTVKENFSADMFISTLTKIFQELIIKDNQLDFSKKKFS